HLYMCVRLSGYLEQLLHQAITAYISDLAAGASRDFALSYFRYSPNLNPGALENLIKRFGEKWSSDLALFLDAGNNKSLLGSLIQIRNDTAHGKSYAGSLAHIDSYKKLVDGIHKWVHERMLD